MTGGPPISNREVQFIPTIIEYGYSWMIGLCCLFIAFKQYRQNGEQWKIRFLITIGSLSLITSPWLGSLHKVVIGAYPTIDKEGSLLFFEHGVHHLWLTHPSMGLEQTGLPLIGVHIGHLWVTEILSIIAPTFVAFNLQICLHLLLNVFAVLYWLDAYTWLKSREWEKWVVAILIGAQLHVFRDIHWYTIEKSALFPLFIFWGVLIRLRKENATSWMLSIAYLGAGLYNFYWAILCPLLVFTEYKHVVTSLKNRTGLGIGLFSCGLIGIALGFLQMTLQEPHLQFAAVEAFAERSALDTFSLWPLDWNRMGLWQPINLALVGMGIYTIRIESTEDYASEIHGLILCGVVCFLLSLGPFIVFDLPNPVFKLFTLLPGMWRFAKPEIFFLITYAICAMFSLRHRWSTWVWALVIVWYLVGLHSSPAYPYLSEFVEGTLHFTP